RQPAVEPSLDLGEGECGPDLDRVRVDPQLTQFRQPVDGDDAGRASTAEVHLDAPVGTARDDSGVGILAQAPYRGGERRGPDELPAVVLQHGRRWARCWLAAPHREGIVSGRDVE